MILSGKSCDTPDLIETTEDFIFSNDIKVIQSKNGYRFNSDSMILSWFVHKSLLRTRIKKSLEIGAGSGVVSIVLKKRGFKSQISCLEIQDSMYKNLSKNILNNNLSSEIYPVFADFRDFSKNESSKYDLIFTNPPFFRVSDGKVNENKEKAVARHEFFGDLNDFFVSSKKILTQNGHFIFVYPLSRLQHAMGAALKNNFVLKNICFFRENPNVAPVSFTAHLINKPTDFSAQSDIVTMKDSAGEYSETGKKIMYYQN